MTVRMKTAVTSRPITDNAVAHVASGNAPLKIKNSPTKPFSPGNPSEENSAMPIRPQKTGATARSPPNSFRPRNPPERRSMKLRKQNTVAAVSPWLNICSNTPLKTAAFSAARRGSSPINFASAKTPSRQ